MRRGVADALRAQQASQPSAGLIVYMKGLL